MLGLPQKVLSLGTARQAVRLVACPAFRKTEKRLEVRKYFGNSITNEDDEQMPGDSPAAVA
jgi:hypothetical protein